jgi:hypothetical protein
MNLNTDVHAGDFLECCTRLGFILVTRASFALPRLQWARGCAGDPYDYLSARLILRNVSGEMIATLSMRKIDFVDHAPGVGRASQNETRYRQVS